ncbi:class I SAM-dependent methyltransferase [Lentilactobacillus sp. SPB1-3]|uniref:Class I SAM-dependent methyltransferase n=1 Tax=Lentilactobacillus terminaliae TaxID=3003483 RepID=A0ACD5DHX2_9LACO|nr:class I SAM-dependent methyltransferase [Lentilactobacillus sp. SPB1-3]MCZ0977010.1 methyltransferase domain-containing protein [Lentilactobacillus sp. SPB1-3]
MKNTLQSSLAFSHTLLQSVVKPGDNVIDATMGNGHDTLFLAQLVQATGHVSAFDIQASAIESTKQLLADNQIADNNYNLYQMSHSQIKDVLPEDSKITAAIFNLGYLPGGDKSVITHSETSIPAIQQCLQMLERHGLVVVVLYYGHPGGESEKEAIIDFTHSLDQHVYNVLQYQFVNQVQAPPICLAFEKR